MGNIPELPSSKQATTGILVDLGTRQVLWAKHPRKGVPIASMTKIMTVLLAFELIQKRKDVSLDTIIQVTREAMKTGGSSVYLDVREKFSLRELLKTIMIKSANDSAQLVAQFFGGGDRERFIKLMNYKARKLYLPATKFYTPHGLADNKRRNNLSSPEGMAILAEQLLEYPLAMKWAATWQETFRSPKSKAFQKFRNHNNLVMTRPNLGCRGVDGLKTGFIRKAGFCITVTCKREKRRLVGVVTGFKRAKTRDKFIRKLLDWGYNKASERYKKEHDWIK
jgi:D-alanyl-D-alanine carboxypeptidase (penicillin-binding protein 5/6)